MVYVNNKQLTTRDLTIADSSWLCFVLFFHSLTILSNMMYFRTSGSRGHGKAKTYVSHGESPNIYVTAQMHKIAVQFLETYSHLRAPDHQQLLFNVQGGCMNSNVASDEVGPQWKLDCTVKI